MGRWVGGWARGFFSYRLGWKEAKRKRGRKERKVYLEVMMRLEVKENSCSSAFTRMRLVGGWVGEWVGWVEEKEAVRMSYCELGVGWVGGEGEGG